MCALLKYTHLLQPVELLIFEVPNTFLTCLLDVLLKYTYLFQPVDVLLLVLVLVPGIVVVGARVVRVA